MAVEEDRYLMATRRRRSCWLMIPSTARLVNAEGRGGTKEEEEEEEGSRQEPAGEIGSRPGRRGRGGGGRSGRLCMEGEEGREGNAREAVQLPSRAHATDATHSITKRNYLLYYLLVSSFLRRASKSRTEVLLLGRRRHL